MPPLKCCFWGCSNPGALHDPRHPANVRVVLCTGHAKDLMSVREALEIIGAAFATMDAFEVAEARLLDLCTANQKALYASLPFVHRNGFLKAIASRCAQ